MVDKNECPIITDWQEMKAEFRMAVAKVDAMNSTVKETNVYVIEIMEHVKHLEKLDVIAQVLGKMAKHLLLAVVSAMVIFGTLLTVYVVRDTNIGVHAIGPGGTGLRIGGELSK